MKLLLKNANIVPMDVEQILESYDILIEKGRIISIMPSIDAPDAETIDCRGKYVIPGLINMHAHSANSDMLPLFLAKGVTSVRNVWGNSIMMNWAKEVDEGIRIGPTIYNTSPLMDGIEFWVGAEIIKSPKDAEAAVKRAIAGSYRIIKTYPDIPRDAFILLMEMANDAHIPVIGHANKFVSVQELIDLGYHGIEHASILPENEEDIIKVAKSGVWNCPTLTIIEELDKFTNKGASCEEHRYYKYVNENERKDWKGIVEMFIKNPRKSYNFLEIAKRARLFAQHSNNYTMGTDNGNPGVVAGFSEHDELELMVKYMELTPYEALRAATVNGARDLGVYSRVGTVTEGKISDLIVLDANPLESISNTKEISYVIKGEKFYDRPSLDKLIQDVMDMDVKDIVFAISNEVNAPDKR
jgi:imidazolonepropionase-like amidohydrolase